MPVDVPGYFLADIGIGRGFGTLGKHASLCQRFNPHLPVFATHYRNGVVDLLLRRGFEMKFLNRSLVGINPFLGRGGTNGF